ncbi:ABC transporter substrate-binding protein [Micromonospora sp. CB01531]|uniref:ABC transporter substrate-binding protein n=1 Tax=Micromonospora sp. CB01531 TaxID=1718947 RepID=UPI00093E2D10|nr:ABC transporter substrate-binding protein [Micromonospora sp. CB01531]OKI63391.1 ABC transporter substrate-binding protein [Micromonospora sp. CB01531]
MTGRSSHRALRPMAALIAAAVVGVVGLSACSGEDSGDNGTNSTLTVDTSFVVKSLDPGAVYEPTGNVVVHALYDTLVTFDGADISKPVPALASAYAASPDGRTFTFTLNPDAKFADGSPVTAADVVFSLDRLKNLKGSAAAIVKDLSFSASDDKTVVVTSTVVNPNVPTILAAPYAGILNSKLAKEHGGQAGTDATSADSLGTYLNENALGSGPYKIESFDVASRIVLTANPNYWGKKPAFGRVVFQNMDVQNQKLTMSKKPTSEIALDLAGDQLSGLPTELQQTSSPSTYYQLRLHADPAISPVTSNHDWAHALQAAIDYQGVAALFGSSGVPAAGIVPTAYAGALPDSEAQKQDLAKATALAAQSGVADQTVKLLYPAITFSGVDLGTIAAKVQSDAAKAGLKIELDPAPIASFLDQRRGGKVAFSFSPQSLDYPSAASIVADLMPGGGAATAAGWTTAKADPATVAAANEVRDALDTEKQVAALQKWQRLMIEHAPYITLAYNAGTVVASSDLSGAQYTAAGWTVDIADIGTK